ncbi:hypothetical protein ACH347_42910 [Saccharopolyspora sp. 5N102]|uniref:hypothetical protein n=1 Tax=Saccharopolyspora sp. 5N102 TaxID=3375155 RepID=UPI0037A6F036
MPRRVPGDLAVEPWEGSAEQLELARVSADHERLLRERVDAALRLADVEAAAAAGYQPSAVRRIAQLNAETIGDVGYLARQLTGEGHSGWTALDVTACIRLLWPPERADQWPHGYGTYPGYLGGLRDQLSITMPIVVLGPRRHQHQCTRCGALWPTGWPDADHRDPSQVRCPDCGQPGSSVGGVDEQREHSIIDLHWLMFRFAPKPVGPCPECGTTRQLIAQGYFDVKERVLYWSCGNADELGTRGQPDSHYLRSRVRAEWESTAAHYAYWLAVDILRLAEQAGEVTELPVGAEYEALDGSGEQWTYLGSGWERTG